jgi:sulfatase modifying factor 1
MTKGPGVPLLPLLLLLLLCAASAAVPTPPKMVAVPAGRFTMGASRALRPSLLYSDFKPGSPFFWYGDADESPAHEVALGAFQIGATEVTNAEYEQYDPSHKQLRGRAGFSTADNEAVVFVSHANATGYAAWLASKLKQPYRLPTEAEWEHAARGSDPATNGSYFWTGDTLPPAVAAAMHIGTTKGSAGGLPNASAGLSLAVGRFEPNSFGLHDTLGNVEEWCSDWHGPYTHASATNPAGPSEGIFRVTRGGSVKTEPYYVRTANRHGALPEERSWVIGFRLALGKLSNSHPQSDPEEEEDARLPPAVAPGYAVPPKNASWPRWSDTPIAPVLRRYVKWPGNGSALPFYVHNHEPTITACPNGDFVANWYSTNCGEEGRCVGLVQSRLKRGASEWTTAKVQLDAPDRNQCCTAFYFDRDSGILYHFSAMSAAGSFQDIIGTLQWSTDCGETYSKPKIIWPDHGIEHQIVVTIIKSTRTGEVLVPCDHWGYWTDLPYGPMEGDQSIVQHAPVERLADPSAWSVNASTSSSGTGPSPVAAATSTQSHHTSIVELRNGSFAAIGRSHDIDGTMPYALSTDGGHVWKAKASSFTGIHGGEREVMIRLGSLDQPLMHCTFANGPVSYNVSLVPDSSGGYFAITGVYCAVSFNDGDSWETRRPMTTDLTATGHEQDGFDGHNFTMRYNETEPNGYMAAAVSEADGLITLITSRNSYTFNLAWLREKAPPPPIE